MPNDPSGINGRSLWSALQRLQFVGGGAASGGGGAVAVRVFCVAVCIDSTVHMLCQGRRCLNDPSGINGRSLWSALQRLQFVGGGAASGGGGAVAVRVFCVAVCIGSTVHMLCQGRRCLNDPSGINGRSLWSALQRLQFVGGGAASGGGGAVAVRVFCVAVCIGSTVHMLCQGRRCPMTPVLNGRSLCQRCSGLQFCRCGAATSLLAQLAGAGGGCMSCSPRPLPQAPSNGSLSLMSQQSLKGLQLRTFASAWNRRHVRCPRPPLKTRRRQRHPAPTNSPITCITFVPTSLFASLHLTCMKFMTAKPVPP